MCPKDICVYELKFPLDRDADVLVGLMKHRRPVYSKVDLRYASTLKRCDCGKFHCITLLLKILRVDNMRSMEPATRIFSFADSECRQGYLGQRQTTGDWKRLRQA